MGDSISAADFKSGRDKILAELTSVRDEITDFKNYGTIAAPLTALLKCEAFLWSPAATEA